MLATPSFRKIGDYAILGNGRTAALVSSDGSIDWLCLPRFDSPAVFSALLDPEGGCFRVTPRGNCRIARRYLPGTAILETTFHGFGWTLLLRDLMPVASEKEKHLSLTSEVEILREIEGIAGEAEVDIVYDPRPGYGRLHARPDQFSPLGLRCQADGGLLVLGTDLDCQPADAPGTFRARIRAGELKHLSLTYADEAPAVIPPLGETAQGRVLQSSRWWQGWSGCCTYEGVFRDAVLRSILVLKLLAFAPSGAIIAAPTTSLPEQIGGSRNWDYRYCWLRDASFTIRAFLSIGYREEAEAFLNWMLHATRLTWPDLQVLYTVFGESHVPEKELKHLRGYRDSSPVRIGNGAAGQFQLDLYGEVIHALIPFAAEGRRFDRDAKRMLKGIGHTVASRWREPDFGIWEARSGPLQHTHSKVLAWTALDCLIRLDEGGCRGLSTPLFHAERAAVRSEIENRGFNARLGSYTRLLDGDDLDASLLTLPLYGYIEAGHPRMRSTYRRVREALGRGSLINRYRGGTDGLQSGEGAFGMCGFWAVECRALMGDLDGAEEDFEQLLTYANDLGLYGEEIDPDTGEALGNFPQAFTHIGLINAAVTIDRCRRHRKIHKE